MSSYLMPTYFNQLPVMFERGQGIWLWDTEGNCYLDALAGIAVCSLGHCHPRITAKIIEQAGKLIHSSNTFLNKEQQLLAEKLCEISGMDQVYFANSGAEANEAAIKMTRLYAKKKGIANPTVITLNNSFHGRTMATLSATGAERIQTGFEPLVSHFVHLDMNDSAGLKAYLEQDKNVVAIMLELVQGDGGISIASPEYVAIIRELCDKQDLLMIVDEVQTGIGRTGKWFCYQHYNVMPDIVTCAKALGNGLPIGACLARGKADNLFGPGKHGTTFGGTHLVCATSLEVLKTFEDEKIVENAEKMGEYLQTQLRQAFAGNSHIVDIRGKGLMIGVELDCNSFGMMPLTLKHKLLFNIVANKVIRLIPPLIISKGDADEIVKRLKLIVDEFLTIA
ncbi:MAG: aspartate aminotransferase family protein [Gammaproteobacteria bacterium]|nr:aspartate aminotransferase family protein [Gammaproteobacteria bacterium]